MILCESCCGMNMRVGVGVDMDVAFFFILRTLTPSPPPSLIHKHTLIFTLTNTHIHIHLLEEVGTIHDLLVQKIVQRDLRQNSRSPKLCSNGSKSSMIDSTRRGFQFMICCTRDIK
jgi:hypothetical protein